MRGKKNGANGRDALTFESELSRLNEKNVAEQRCVLTEMRLRGLNFSQFCPCFVVKKYT